MNRIAVLGAGHLGEALIAGWLHAGVTDANHLATTVRSAERALGLSARLGIPVTAGANHDAAAAADIIVLAVRPDAMAAVTAEIREDLSDDQVLVSLAASFPIAHIEKLLHRSAPVIRALPNIPAAIGRGVTTLAANAATTTGQRALVEDLFRAVGLAVFVEEPLLHAATALAASGPAYVYLIIDALIEAGVRMGLAGPLAAQLAVHTVSGAAVNAQHTALDPAELCRELITPGGVTGAAIAELEKHGMRQMFAAAIEAGTRHSEARARRHAEAAC